jgi:acetyltransferase-like isoleucine patch superfamily enzyme
VHIEDNVWISVQAVVLHGSSIGRDSVIGACSLVRGRVPAGVFAAGNPLKIIRSVPEC